MGTNKKGFLADFNRATRNTFDFFFLANLIRRLSARKMVTLRNDIALKSLTIKKKLKVVPSFKLSIQMWCVHLQEHIPLIRNLSRIKH